MGQPLACWKCRALLTGLALPIGRREECPSCSTDLHACRLCEFYDPTAHNECREPVADEVVDKDRANFCDYFRPRTGENPGSDSDSQTAKAKLKALFRDSDGLAFERPSGNDAATQPSTARSEADAARAKLDKLFGGCN